MTEGAEPAAPAPLVSEYLRDAAKRLQDAFETSYPREEIDLIDVRMLMNAALAAHQDAPAPWRLATNVREVRTGASRYGDHEDRPLSGAAHQDAEPAAGEPRPVYFTRDIDGNYHIAEPQP